LAGAAGEAPTSFAVLAAALVFLAFLALFCWLAVRLSLVLPATFDRRRLQIGSAWRLTKGRFWPLFGMYVLSFVLVIVISLLGTVILFPLAALLGGGLSGASEALRADYSSLGTWFGPVTLLSLVLSAILTAITNAVQVAPAAEAYRELGGVRGADAADVFS
jgi:hypothetical protein